MIKYLYHSLRRFKRIKNNLIWSFRKKSTVLERKIVRDYLHTHEIRKLQIGCGGQSRSGWLNTNYESRRESVIFLDASKTFPIDAEQFDFVFSEHMIEHISHEKGMNMLRESYRILKPGGVIRISTPDLKFLLALYGSQKTAIEESYLQWAAKNIPLVLESCEDTFVINNFVRDWGHQFIYDEKTLKASLESVGFTNVTGVEINQSNYPELTGMESEARMPEGFLTLESIVMEGVKA